MRCLSCNYELKNLPEHRCPECGRAFDPADPDSFLQFSVTKMWREATMELLTVLFAIGIAFLTLALFFWLFVLAPLV